MIGDDEMAQAYTERDLETNLRLLRVPPPERPGLDECEECGGGISADRRDAGARRCVPCQSDAEIHERVRAGARG